MEDSLTSRTTRLAVTAVALAVASTALWSLPVSAALSVDDATTVYRPNSTAVQYAEFRGGGDPNAQQRQGDAVSGAGMVPGNAVFPIKSSTKRPTNEVMSPNGARKAARRTILYRSRNGSVSRLAGQKVTSCVTYRFRNASNVVSVVAKHTSERFQADSCLNKNCGKNPGLLLFAKQGSRVSFVRRLRISSRPQAFNASLGANADSVVLCRGGGGHGRDNVELTAVYRTGGGSTPVVAAPPAPPAPPVVKPRRQPASPPPAANQPGTRAVNAGPIWNQADAEKKCPALARRNNATWTGHWWTTVQGKMSVCQLKPGKKPAAAGTFTVNAGPIWNQADAEKKCPALAKRNKAAWTSEWWTTVQGKMSVCQMRRSGTFAAKAGPIWNQADANTKCVRLSRRNNAKWTGHWWTTVQGKMSVCQLNAAARPAVAAPKPKPAAGTRAVNAGPIWNQADANKKCPALARRNNATWTGHWWTTVQGKMSVCQLKPRAAKPATFTVKAGPIWNQADANRKCANLARQRNATWTGQWWTTVQGKMSVCQMKAGAPKPKTFTANAGPIWNQADAKTKCANLARRNNARWTGQWWTTVQGKMSVCQLSR